MSIQETSNAGDNQKAKPGRKPNYQESGAKNKQRCNFARGVADHGDKVRARREAGYKASKNEYVLACRMSEEEDIVTAIGYWREKNRATLDLRSEVVLGEIHSIAFSNIVDVWEWDEAQGLLTLKDITKLPRRITAAIQEVSTVKRTYYDQSLEQEVTEIAYKVKMHNKWQALKHIAGIIKEHKSLVNPTSGTEKRRKVVEVKLVGMNQSTGESGNEETTG